MKFRPIKKHGTITIEIYQQNSTRALWLKSQSTLIPLWNKGLIKYTARKRAIKLKKKITRKIFFSIINFTILYFSIDHRDKFFKNIADKLITKISAKVYNSIDNTPISKCSEK